MLFTTPIWLLGLLPWAVAAALLFLGRRPRWDVPFLQLWRLEMPKDAARRRFAVPPVGVILGLFAALLAVLAAAGPGLRGAAGGSGTVIIVDTGTSMSAVGSSGKSERFREMLDDAAADLRAAGATDAPVQLVAVPSAAGVGDNSLRTTAGKLSEAGKRLSPTALATPDQVSLAARQALAASASDVLVITDHALPFADERLVVIAPERSPRNIGIATFSIRRSPRPQAMVRIGRTGAIVGKQSVKLRISSGGRSTDQDVALPPAGATRDAFVPLPAIGATASAELLDAADDFTGDDRADLVAEADWPVLEPAAPLGDLRRLADLYAANRPAGERSIHLRLVANEPDLRRSPGIVLASLAGPAKPTRVTTVAAHPITQPVTDWRSFDVPAAADRRLPEGNWNILLSDSAGPLLAVRELGASTGADRPIRQVWTALDVAGWSNRPEYVVFWSAVFDWAGNAQGGERMDAAPLVGLTSQWRPVELSPGPADARFWPGVYERPDDGARRAFGPAAPFGAIVTLTPAERATRLAAMVRRGQHVTPLAPWLLLAALVAALAAALAWKRRQVERTSAPGALTGVFDFKT